MAAGIRGRDLQRGETFGCWTILRESSKTHRRRYFAVATCCGRKRVTDIRWLLKAKPKCFRCMLDERIRVAKESREAHV